jgi:RimJ/RimL family protein N-acetyltransferase
MTRFDTIETKRLVLRRWQDADREPFAELNGDPGTLVFFPSTLARAESDALIGRTEARFEEHGYGLWALEVRETGQFIGFTGLAPMPDDVPGAGGTEIGWRLARHAWHQGYATEAALAARDVAFTGAGLPELWSMTAVLNTPSQAVMRRIGMTEAARFEHPRVPEGSPLKPHVVYHLDRPGAGALAPRLTGQRSGPSSRRRPGLAPKYCTNHGSGRSITTAITVRSSATRKATTSRPSATCLYEKENLTHPERTGLTAAGPFDSGPGAATLRLLSRVGSKDRDSPVVQRCTIRVWQS